MGCSHRKFRNHSPRVRFADTGNSAFDGYRNETLRRLEEEQTAFQGFLDRLRQAKDKAEFDQFMKDRDEKAAGSNEVPA